MVVELQSGLVGMNPRDRMLNIGVGWSCVLKELPVRRSMLHPEAFCQESGTGQPEATVLWSEN